MKNLYKYRNKKESPHFWGQGFCRYWCHLWIYESVFSQFRFLRFLNPNAFRSIFLIRKPYCPWPPIHTDVTGPWMQRDDTMFRINERKKRGKKTQRDSTFRVCRSMEAWLSSTKSTSPLGEERERPEPGRHRGQQQGWELLGHVPGEGMARRTQQAALLTCPALLPHSCEMGLAARWWQLHCTKALWRWV